jgi:hypothetical protein
MKTPRRLGPNAARRLRSRIRREARIVPPRKDPAVEMLKGIGLDDASIIGHPLRDCLFMPVAEQEERKRIQREVDAFENHPEACGFSTYHVTGPSGQVYRADEWIEMTRRCAYDMLRKGADVRHVAKATFWQPEQVLAFAKEFNFDVRG